MNKIITFALMPTLFSFTVQASELHGSWKSNAELTLKSMAKIEDQITLEAKELFSNDFFGHLIAEYKETEGRSYFDYPEDNTEEMYEFRPYNILEETPQYFLIIYHDWLEEEEVTKKLHREGDCYYSFLSKWNFKEYFCKIKN